MLESYLTFKNMYLGSSAFVCGAGISFLECLENPNFIKIHNHIVVSVNSSFIGMPWSKGSHNKRFWVSNDALVRWWSYWDNVKKAKANCIVRDSWRKYEKEIPNFYEFSPRSTSEGIINSEETGLCYCSSIPTAIDLCIQMGCRDIFLLGVDQYFAKDGKTHFWQMLPKDRQPVRIDGRMASHKEQNNAFSYNDLAFFALSKFAYERRSYIYNCSMKSRIGIFPKIEFEEALEIARKQIHKNIC